MSITPNHPDPRFGNPPLAPPGDPQDPPPPDEQVVDHWVEEESPEGRPAEHSGTRWGPYIVVAMVLFLLVAAVVTGLLVNWWVALIVFGLGGALGVGANPEVWAATLRWNERREVVHDHTPTKIR